MSEDPEAKWARSIAGLVETIVRIPPHQIVPPVYRLNSNVRVWRIRLGDGRTGWAREFHNYYDAVPVYFLPPDVAELCELHWLIASGLTQDKVRNSGSGSFANFYRDKILSVSADRWAALTAEVAAIDARPPFELPLP